MAKIGDTVRYLNAVGGGKVTRIEGKMAYVDEDGFETPVLLSEVVVVLPAGHEPKTGGARLMFDQSAADAMKAREAADRRAPELSKEIKTADIPAKPVPVEETAHGERINLTLAFEPVDIKKLSETTFAAVLVNDSNYFLAFTFLTCEGDSRRLCYEGTVEPNMVVDLATFTHADLNRFGRVELMALPFKRDKAFAPKDPLHCSRKVDLKKFYKLHCFRPGEYFDNPVMEIPLVRNDVPVAVAAPDAEALRYAMSGPAPKGDAPRRKAAQTPSPHKLLPPVEVDLHIHQLVDNTAGMDNAAMMQLQLDTVRRTMREHARRIGQKIIFIHGKGDGVLREAVRSLLRREWGACELQDASFREYGFGATLVTVRTSGNGKN